MQSKIASEESNDERKEVADNKITLAKLGAPTPQSKNSDAPPKIN